MKTVIVFLGLLALVVSYDGVELSEDNEGYVEVEVDGESGYVCADDGFNDEAAQVICRSLGYTGGQVASSDDVEEYDDPDSDTAILLTEVNCNGDEANLGDCEATDFDEDEHECDDIAAVVCDEETIEVRLEDGEVPWEGRLEVTHEGEWGYACAADFNEEAAEVVCAMLGFEGGYIASDEDVEDFGLGDEDSEPVLSDVACSGDEDNIGQCSHAGWDNADCDVDEIVGIICDAPFTTVPPGPVVTAASATQAPAATAPAATAAAATAAAETAAATTPAATDAPTTPAATAAAETAAATTLAATAAAETAAATTPAATAAPTTAAATAAAPTDAATTPAATAAPTAAAPTDAATTQAATAAPTAAAATAAATQAATAGPTAAAATEAATQAATAGPTAAAATEVATPAATAGPTAAAATEVATPAATAASANLTIAGPTGAYENSTGVY